MVMTAISTRLVWGHDRYGHVWRDGRRRYEWRITEGRDGKRAIASGRSKSEDSAWQSATEAAAGADLYGRQPW